MADPVHQAVVELIPWYVNGTLAEREMDQVSGHVANCAACARVVEQEVAMARRVRTQPAGLERLLAQQGQAFTKLQNSLRYSSEQTKQWYRPAAVAAVVALVVMSFLVGRASLEPTFEVMTNNVPYHGTVVQLIFHPQTREQDIRHLLADGGSELLGSPSPKGVYRIGLPPNVDARAYATRLKEHPAVRWAEVELR